MPASAPKNIDEFLARVASDEFIQLATDELRQSPARVRELIATYSNETRHGYNLISPYLEDGMRVLEVGAGIGVLATYLHLKGFEIVAIEPSGVGFDLNHAIGKCLIRWLELDDFELQDLGVEDLQPSRVGEFDLIFSVNVVEHLPDLDAAFGSMRSVLAADGKMVHTCPNYHVPYEPHFAIPLLPVFPSATRFLLRKSITSSDLWHSFNFVTSTRLKRITREHRLNIEFEPDTLYRSFQRMGEDPIFAARHKGFIAWVYRVLTFTGAIRLLRRWPAMLSSPINFVCRHSKDSAASRAVETQ